MLFPVLNNSNHLSISTLVVATTVVIAVLIPISASALPITPHEPTPSPLPPSPDVSHMSRKVIFDILFGLGLFILTIGAFVCVASSKSCARFNGVIDRMCDASDTLRRHLSSFHLTTFIARAGNAFAGTNNARVPSTRNEGDEVRRVPVVSPPSIPLSPYSPDPRTGHTVSTVSV